MAEKIFPNEGGEGGADCWELTEKEVNQHINHMKQARATCYVWELDIHIFLKCGK